MLINGNPLDETSYLSPTISTQGESYMKEGDTITVPANMYFVCGDNRQHSSDSREFGPISFDAIKGKTWIVWYPFTSFRVVKHANT